MNADSPLSIGTYVVTNDEVVHPSVVDAGSAWNGYRYWMAATPFTNGDAQYENPSVWGSNDKETWVVPDGLTNPVEAEPATGFWSDPHLVMHDGTLHLFFRGSGVPDESGNEVIELRTSADGVTWTAKTTVLSHDPLVTRNLSPAVVRDSDGTWRMWFVDIVPDPYVLRMYTASAPDGTWTEDSECQLPPPDGKQLWHLDVQAANGEYWMLLNVTNVGSNAGGLLYAARSADGVTWRRDVEPLISTRGGEWDASLYRGCWLPNEYGAWDVWYGASSPDWLIGKTTARFFG